MSLEINMNRLNLPNMVDRQLKGTVIPTETYFNPLIIAGKRKTLEQKPKQQNALKTEIETSVNSIVATVHRKLKTQQKPKKVAKKVVDIKMPSLEARSKGDGNESKPEPKTEPISTQSAKPKGEMAEMKPAEKNNILRNTNILPLKSTSIPQIKAKRDQRQQQRMRRNILKYSEINDAMHQKRILEVKKQKRILEDMLMQHQRLQRDRRSIAMEIQSMREHLSDIRNKLDVSLRKLSTSPAICKMPSAKPSSNMRQQVRKPVSPIRSNRRPISTDRHLATRPPAAQTTGRPLSR